MRQRGARNRIDLITKESGEIVDTPKGIEKEILEFYGNLLGTSSSLFALNPDVMK